MEKLIEPIEILQQAKKLHQYVTLITASKNNGEGENFVLKGGIGDAFIAEGDEESLCNAVQNADAVLLRTFTGRKVAGEQHVEIRAYVVNKSEGWEAEKMSGSELRNNCARDPETGDLLPPRLNEEFL